MGGPTQTINENEWPARPRLAFAIRIFLLLAPVVSAFALAYFISRTAPPWRLGMNPILWWISVFTVANTYLLLADRFLTRYLPIATLFRLSLIFPDQAPSRFKTSLRSTNSRKALQRLEDARQSGEWSDEIKHSEILLLLVNALSDHDRLTRGHAERVQAYCDLIAEELELPDDDRVRLRWGALLHDMGKLDVPAEILNKPERPNDEEWAILQTHPAAGNGYVEPLRPWLGDWLGAVDEHHCRWDGKGYPYNRAGEEITLAGRIAAVADAYDVMTSIRSYKKAKSAELARQELARGAGTQFDPTVVRAFLQIGIGKLRLVAGPLAWLAGSVGSVPSPVVGPAVAVTSAVVASFTGIFAGYDNMPSPDLAFVDETPEIVIEDATPVTSEPIPVQSTTSTTTTTTTVVVTTTTTQPPTTTTTTTTTTVAPTTAAPTTVGNLRPVAANDFIATAEDTAVILWAMANDSDPDGDGFTITSASAPTNGSVTVSADRTTIIYTPAPNFSGTDTFTYVVTDDRGATSTATATVDVTPINDPPVLSVFTGLADEAQPAGADVGAVAVSDIDGGAPVFTIVGGDPGGDFTIDPSTGVISITRPLDFETTPTYTLTVEVFDGVNTVSQTVTITVADVNEAPSAASSRLTVAEGGSITSADLTALHTDPEGDALTVSSVRFPGVNSASVTTDGSAITYVHDGSETASDSISYEITDSAGNVAIGSIAVTVTPVNDPPITTPISATVAENTVGAAVTVVPATDPEDQPLSFSIVGGDPGGEFSIVPGPGGLLGAQLAVTGAAGEITTASALDFETTPSYVLTIEISDGVNVVTDTVTVTVLDVNDPPAAATSSLTVAEGGSVTSADLTALHTDPEGDPLTVSSISFVGVNSASTTTDGSTVTYTHDGSETVSDSLSYVITDTAGNSATGTINVTVTPVNDPPVVSPLSGSVGENLPAGEVVGTVAVSDVDGGAPTFAITGGDPLGEFTIDAATGEVTTTAPLDFEATPSYTLTVSVSDGVDTVSQTVSVSVVDANEAPGPATSSLTVAEGGSITSADLTVLHSDPEGDVLTITSVTAAGANSLSATTDGTTVTYTHDGTETTSDTVTYEISDIAGNTSVGTINVVVTPVNDPPLTSPVAGSVDENLLAGQSVVFVAASDPEGQPLSFAITGGDPLGEFNVAPTTGEITTAAPLDFEATPTYTLTVEVSDGVNTVGETVTVTVLDVNEAPAPASSSLTVAEGGSATSADLTALHTDPEGDALTVTLVTGPGANSVSTTTDGATVTYSHDGSETSADTVTYNITDTAGNTAVGTINVTVTPVNDPPVVSPLSGSVTENLPAGQVIGTVAVTDVDGGAPTFAITGGDPLGEFTIDATTGEVTTTAPLDFEVTSSYTLTVAVSDGVDTVSQTVSISVLDANEAPAPATSSLAVAEGGSITSADLTVLHTDPEGDALTVTSITSAGANSTSATTDGTTVTYTHDGSETSTDTVTYEISDIAGNIAVGTINVTVTPVNDPPITSPSTGAVDEGLVAGQSVVFVTASDPEGQPLSYTVTAGDPLGEFTVAPTTGEITTTGPLDFEAASTYTLTVEVSDGVHIVTETITINVNDVNEAPAPATSSLTVDEGGSITSADLTALHTDPEGDALTITLISDPGANSISTTTDGTTATYTHDGSETTSDTIVYVISDTAGNTATGTINVTVNPTNDPPILSPIPDQTAYVNVPFTMTFPFSDVDGFVVDVTAGIFPGSMTLDVDFLAGTATLSGTPVLAELDTVWPILVQVTDDQGAATTTTFTLTIDPIGLSPHAGNIVISEVLYAESDPYDTAAPFAAYLMDEFIEFSNVGAAAFDIENFYLTDTPDPSVQTDFAFHTGVPPYLPEHTGRINQAFTQPTLFSPGQFITAPIRRPSWTQYFLQDGSLRPAIPYALWFRGVDYGFPPGPNSNWEALENSGDDLWFWDADGLLVAFVAWDDGTGNAHIAGRPPAALGIWDPSAEARLAGAAPGQSISLVEGTDNSLSACWERTASGDAIGACPGAALPTEDVDPPGAFPPPELQGRVSSQGTWNG